MARQASGEKSQKTRKADLDREWRQSHKFTFVNIPLSEDDRDEILSGVLTSDQLAAALARLVCEDGYKVGFNWSHDDQCFIVSVTGQLYSRDDWNRCVTSRHAALLVAFTIALFKHTRHCSDGIPAPSQRAGDGETFD